MQKYYLTIKMPFWCKGTTQEVQNLAKILTTKVHESAVLLNMEKDNNKK